MPQSGTNAKERYIREMTDSVLADLPENREAAHEVALRVLDATKARLSGPQNITIPFLSRRKLAVVAALLIIAALGGWRASSDTADAHPGLAFGCAMTCPWDEAQDATSRWHVGSR
jgi:hypothetical protein